MFVFFYSVCKITAFGTPLEYHVYTISYTIFVVYVHQCNLFASVMLVTPYYICAISQSIVRLFVWKLVCFNCLKIPYNWLNNKNVLYFIFTIRDNVINLHLL